MTSIRVRKTTNMNIIHTLDAQIFDYATDDPVSTDGAVWWVVFDGNKPIAFAGAKKLENENLVYLCRAGVLPSYRGKGLQKKLIEVRLAWARKQQVKKCITYTMPSNVASSNNLIRKGFTMYIPEFRWGGTQVLYWMIIL